MKRALLALAFLLASALVGSATAKEIDCTGDDCDTAQMQVR